MKTSFTLRMRREFWDYFHQAWGEAKSEPDYDKHRWEGAQELLEATIGLPGQRTSDEDDKDA